MTDYSKLDAFFEEIIQHYEVLRDFELEKLHMIQEDRVEELEKSISREQALIMKTNSLEQQRMKLMGSATMTFQQLIDQSPLQYRDGFIQKKEALASLISQIKEMNEAAQANVKNRLEQMRKSHAELNDTMYSRAGAKENQSALSKTLDKDV